ncbi:MULTISPECIES: hypothetical protein [Pyrobaculum]|uniref:Uncharacterized protein n=3 Tax=Pyrobaculum TaxID=2276 RepID=A4WL24_PYRAR|nr:hypothetical protein [Pyrobaculum arsenaticum]ABP51091.1 conserved hypothetical protein [Pyrobaculum arsenaticum DSM 13514]MCY0891671.1 hypothetical protein [Pyrobaculum arsenaticum]NYR15184.1 hypothetical protein [Pyrobaculum arsenaticum]
MVLIRVDGNEEVVSTVEDLEKLCKRLREELQRAQCQYHSWYIRIPPDRLLALLKKAYMKYLQGMLSVGDVLAEFLDENKLSKSLARVITPTLSALGLTAGGKFTATAVEVGRLLHEGRLDEAKELLRAIFAKNCVLKEVMDKASDCSSIDKEVESVLAGYGKRVRFDELKYTTELLRFVHPSCEDCDFSCATPSKVVHCAEKVVQLSVGYWRELFEKLDISILPEHFSYIRLDDQTFLVTVKGTDKRIGMILLGQPIESGHLSQLKTSLSKLDEKIVEGMYEVYVKIIPMLEGEGKCRSVKLLLEVVRGDLERASKIIKIA